MPGCGAKIAKLYLQWTSGGYTDETKAAAVDTELTVLRKFYDIWGVADVTARHFFKKGMLTTHDLLQWIVTSDADEAFLSCH